MEQSLSRRHALGGLGVVAGGMMAGCLSASTPSQTRLAEIVLLNMDDRPHTISLWVDTAEGTVFEIEREIPPEDDTQPVLTHEDGVPTAAANYTVRATVDGGVDTIERSYPDDGNGDCYALTLRINRDGTIRDLPSDGTADSCVS